MARNGRQRWLRLICFVTALVGTAQVVTAQPGEASPVDDAYEQGREYLRANRAEDALRFYQSRFESDGSVRALYGIVQSERVLARWPEAYGHVLLLLARSDDSWLRSPDQWRRVLEARDAIRTHLGSLRLTSTPPDAEWLVDDAPAPEHPEEIVLAAGPHRVRVRHPMLGTSDVVVVEVPATEPGDGPLAAVAVHLDLPPRNGSESNAVSAAEVDVPRVDVTPDPGVHRSSTSSIRRRHAGGVLAGVGAGIAALGVSVLALRARTVTRWNDDTRCDRVYGVERSSECPREVRVLRWTRVASPLTLTVAGASLATGIAFMTLKAHDPDARSWHCIPFAQADLRGGTCVHVF